MVEIGCLACGKAVKPQQLNDTDNYDTENYDGEVICQECKSRLHVKLVKGKVQKYKIVEKKSGDFDFTELIMRRQKERNQQ
jgi:DNA-directed RNA polymerase subunit RPC12/RpoP